MNNVRFGIIGLGNMGRHHVSYFDKIKDARITAVCDSTPQAADAARAMGAPIFDTFTALLDSGLVDAIFITTPHRSHGEIARAAFARNVHVLMEKPAAVSVKDARHTNETFAKHPNLKFGIMFQQRTLPLYRKLHELIREGELGELTRLSWTVTDWFRTWTYYGSGSWRGTWAGEGGGVLINQCPHNLDLLQWLAGMMPRRVTAVASVGKTHPIEVEDEVSAILEYESGAIGHFVTSTGEAPGSNRLEICGDRGKIVAENGKLLFSRTRRSVRDIRENSREAFNQVESWNFDVPITPAPEGHQVITENFVQAVLHDAPLIAPGVEGVRGLELGNAMVMAGLTRKPVELPLDGDVYDQFLAEMIKQYGGRKTVQQRSDAVTTMAGSFARP